MAWARVLAVEEIGPGERTAAEVEGQDLVVWWPVGGDPVVSDARCPHQWSHLGHEGVVDGAELVCASHLWRFDADGRGSKLNVLGRRDPKGDLACFPTRQRDGWIEADL